MEDLRHDGLQALIDRALKERLVDACVTREDTVVIVQGSMRIELTPVRAHAFLRGVIEGMSRVRARQGHLTSQADASGASAEDVAEPDVPERYQTVDAFRHYLLNKWWTRYEEAGCPFGRDRQSLMLWIRYGSATTSN